MALLVWVVNIDRQEPQNGQTDDDLIKFKLFFLTTTTPGETYSPDRAVVNSVKNFFKTVLAIC